MDIRHHRPDRTSPREITVQKQQIEYEYVSTEWKYQSILLDVHIFPFRFAKFLYVSLCFFVVCGFFPKWKLDFNRYPLMTNLLFLSCPHKPSSSLSLRSDPERSHDKHQYPASAPLPCTSGDTGKQCKREGGTSDVWGNFSVEMICSKELLTWGEPTALPHGALPSRAAVPWTTSVARISVAASCVTCYQLWDRFIRNAKVRTLRWAEICIKSFVRRAATTRWLRLHLSIRSEKYFIRKKIWMCSVNGKRCTTGRTRIMASLSICTKSERSLGGFSLLPVKHSKSNRMARTITSLQLWLMWAIPPDSKNILEVNRYTW